jgi:putative signal transducing protein
MKVVFSSLNLVELHHLKNLLESAGVRCRIHREMLSRLAGEIPFPECAAQLLVERPEDEERAQEIVREFGRPARAAVPWTCGGCGERLEGQFTACWKCGAPRS